MFVINFVFILLILKFHHYTLGFKSASQNSSALSLKVESNYYCSVRDSSNLVAEFIISWSRGRESLQPHYSVVWGTGNTSF